MVSEQQIDPSPDFADPLHGTNFGDLTYLRSAPRQNGRARCVARCKCGSVKTYLLGNLKSVKTTSCGCARGGDRKSPGAKAAQAGKAGKAALPPPAFPDDFTHESLRPVVELAYSKFDLKLDPMGLHRAKGACMEVSGKILTTSNRCLQNAIKEDDLNRLRKGAFVLAGAAYARGEHPGKRNYYDRELSQAHAALKRWHAFLQGTAPDVFYQE